jgi:hypothetical protein
MTTLPAGPRGWRNLDEQPVVETPWFRQALAESGWEAIAPQPLLTLQQNSGLTDSAVHVFATSHAVHRGPPEADFEAEKIEWIRLADAPALKADGEVKDASTAAALLWLSATPGSREGDD